MLHRPTWGKTSTPDSTHKRAYVGVQAKVNRLGKFFDVIHQDPVLSQVKLIAEPWDIGEGG